MKPVVSCLLLMLIAFFADKPTAQPLKQFDAEIDAPPAVLLVATHQDGSEDNGVGLLVWIPSKGCFVATANHVLRGLGNSAVPKSVTISRRQFLQPDAVSTLIVEGKGPYDSDADVAAFPVSLAEDDCGSWKSVKRLIRGQNYYFIGRNGDWYIPTTPAAYNSSSSHGLLFDGMETIPSMSGAPVYGEEGVAGLVTNKFTVSTALVAPIQKVISLLLTQGQRADDLIMLAIDYVNAQAMGAAYVKKNQSDFEATLPPDEIEGNRGEVNFQDVVLMREGRPADKGFSPSPPAAYVFWITGGRGGGNHSEQMLSAFTPIGNRYKPRPDFELQVGLRGNGFLDMPALHVSNLYDGTIDFPGCQSNGTMSDCSIPSDFYYKYCPNNAEIKLNWVATFKATEKPDPTDNTTTLTSSLMGVTLGSPKNWNINQNAPQTISDVGLRPGSTVTAFEVDRITEEKRSKHYGLGVGDFLASIGGATAKNREDFDCLLGEKLKSSSSVKMGVIKAGTKKIVILDVWARGYTLDDDSP